MEEATTFRANSRLCLMIRLEDGFLGLISLKIISLSLINTNSRLGLQLAKMLQMLSLGTIKWTIKNNRYFSKRLLSCLLM